MKSRIIFVSHHISWPFILAGILVIVSVSLVHAQLDSIDIENLRIRGLQEGWTFTVGETPVTKYPLEQLCGFRLSRDELDKIPLVEIQPRKDLPAAFDWRDQNGCTPVKSQGNCGSCWAFGTVGALECNILIRDGVIRDISEQWLVSCNQDDWGCNGGGYAFDYFIFASDFCGGSGAVLEQDFPYGEQGGSGFEYECECPYPHHYWIDSWGRVAPGMVPETNAIKQAIMDYGPVAAGVCVDAAFGAYIGGIFNACWTSMITNHMIVLVGWDDNQGDSGVWILRNSWGSAWGEDGYMRIQYRCSKVGTEAAFVVYTSSRKLAFEYPAGRPKYISPENPTVFDVIAIPSGSGIPLHGTGRIHYSINGEPYVTEALTEILSNQYQVSLPPLPCGSEIRYYFSADEQIAGTFYDPDPLSPYAARSVSDVTTVFVDNFEEDFGWTVYGDALNGQWERGVPVGGGDRGDPETDYDGSGSCYLTGNADDNSDVDAGFTNLVSPVFDLSGGDAFVDFACWFVNSTMDAPSLDELKIFVSSNGGATWALAESMKSGDLCAGWCQKGFWVSQSVIPTDQTRIRFEASDLDEGSLIEAAIDAFEITDYSCAAGDQITIASKSEMAWTVNQPLSIPLFAVGGTTPYTWEDKSNSLSGSGLQLSSEGLLHGIPVSAESSTFTALVTDANLNSDEREITININEPIAPLVSPSDWTVGTTYHRYLMTSGGTGDVIWSDLNNDLDGTGLVLSDCGLLSGEPSQEGPIEFTASVMDLVEATANLLFSFMINPPLAITTDSLPPCSLGIDYTFPIETCGGTNPILFFECDSANVLEETGLLLSEDGLLSGIPVILGEFEVSLRAGDICGSEDQRQLVLKIVRPYTCGDANGDNSINIGDAVYLINHIFAGGPPPGYEESGDANCDGGVNIGDAVYLINHIFASGEAPCCP